MNCTNQKESASCRLLNERGQRVNHQLVAGSKDSSSSRISLLSSPHVDGLLGAHIAAPSAACGILSSTREEEEGHHSSKTVPKQAKEMIRITKPDQDRGNSPMRFAFGSHGDLGSSAPPNSLGCVPVPLDLGPRRVDPNLDYHDSLSIQQTMLRLSSSINKTWSCNFYLLFTKKE